MKLSGRNFQCWSEFDFDIDGLTVILGPSNKGKSSLFRALKGLLRNDIPEGFVRNKQDNPLEIELEVAGHAIKATRTRKGSTKYLVDGVPYSSLGGKVPEELSKLGFGEVQVGDYTVDPIFSNQNKAQFLIDSDRWKPQELNAILGAFSNTEKLDAGKKEANLRITQKRGEASTLATEIRSAEERSSKLSSLTVESSMVADSLHTFEKAARAEEGVAVHLSSAMYHRSRLTPLEELRDTLTLPDITIVSALYQKTGSLSMAAQSLQSSGFFRELESAIDATATTWNDVVVLYKKGRAFTELFGVIDRSKDAIEEYATQLGTTLEKVETLFSEVKFCNSSIAYVEVAIGATQSRKEFTEQLGELNAQLEVAEEGLESLRQQSAAEEAARAAIKPTTQPGLCPVCGETLEHICR